MQDLTPLLSEPGTSIAVIGATDHPTKYGGIIYRDMKGKGFPVFAVNPYRESVDGDPCWATVRDLPEAPTIAVFGNNPDLVQEHYVRYLHNGFRESWGFTGNPLRILMRRKAG